MRCTFKRKKWEFHHGSIRVVHTKTLINETRCETKSNETCLLCYGSCILPDVYIFVCVCVCVTHSLLKSKQRSIYESQPYISPIRELKATHLIDENSQFFQFFFVHFSALSRVHSLQVCIIRVFFFHFSHLFLSANFFSCLSVEVRQCLTISFSQPLLLFVVVRISLRLPPSFTLYPNFGRRSFVTGNVTCRWIVILMNRTICDLIHVAFCYHIWMSIWHEM